MICVVDYGMGNLRSVSKALEALKGAVRVSDDPKVVKRADKIVLPGVGGFGQAMKELKRLRLIEPLLASIKRGKPFLGICLGLQLLMERSDESPGIRGLGVIPGKVRRIPSSKKRSFKIPQMGWNQVTFKKRSPLIRGVSNNSYFYFVHSYYADPLDSDVTLGTTYYGLTFASMFARDHLFAAQFHPEKSQSMGLAILKNFINF